MKIRETAIPGCIEIQPTIHRDERGTFVKPFHRPTFEALGLCVEFAEEYYSVSRKHVIRGMHFQLPPHDHVKLVYCTSGKVMDVVIDLRKGSATYGKHTVIELSGDKANAIYIPQGLAHGFCVLSEQATMIYKVSTVHAPASDAGIRWDACGVKWPVANPIVSERDKGFPTLDAFKSPFLYEGIDQ